MRPARGWVRYAPALGGGSGASRLRRVDHHQSAHPFPSRYRFFAASIRPISRTIPSMATSSDLSA